MNKFLTAATTALTLSVAVLATPAFADQNSSATGYGGGAPKASQSHDDNDFDRGDNGRGARGGASHNFDQNDERGFDSWERGWKRGGYGDYGHQHTLSYRKLVRRLEHQGYFGVRGLRQSQFGFGLRAFAFSGRGFPVMLRINPYTGKVLEARRVGRRQYGRGGW